MSVNICEFCGCEFLWGHACGESCLCDMCSECDKVKNECECQLENDYLTLCEGHKLELENLKNNPPLWAIRARRGK